MSKSVFSYYLGLGSNLGNRVSNINKCLQHIQSIASIQQTSFLYESQPMYYTSQSPFLNAAVSIESSMDPTNLLNQLKHIEKRLMNREENFKNGPRIIDIDILCGFQNSKEIHFQNPFDSTPFHVQIPHPMITERNFVLTPLADLIPHHKLTPHNQTVHELSQTLLQKDASHNLTQVLPLKTRGDHSILHAIDNSDHSLKHKTLLMAILNITPDSFSDGGTWMHDTGRILQYLDTQINVNKTQIDIIDIGGQSTRPNSQRLSVQQELDRIMPVLQCIHTHFDDIPISVDTYSSDVAKTCVSGGYGDIINDISGGTMDECMYDVVAELGMPYVCMHLRGDPSTMQNECNLKYGHDVREVLPIVTQELHQRVSNAQRAGVAAWNIILDPGIGFAKTSEQNQCLLQNMHQIKNNSKYPILSGCSRKSYLNQILGDDIVAKGADSKEKIIGTQAAVTASIFSGADIIRVHDLYTMDVTRRVSDSIFNVNKGKTRSLPLNST
eukprot:247625_1